MCLPGENKRKERCSPKKRGGSKQTRWGEKGGPPKGRQRKKLVGVKLPRPRGFSGKKISGSAVKKSHVPQKGRGNGKKQLIVKGGPQKCGENPKKNFGGKPWGKPPLRRKKRRVVNWTKDAPTPIGRKKEKKPASALGKRGKRKLNGEKMPSKRV